jgi:protein TonB
MYKLGLIPVVALTLCAAACASNPPAAKPNLAQPASSTPTPSDTHAQYFQSVTDHLAKFSAYPPGVAGQYGYGDVLVVITTARDGTVQSAAVRQSSGHPVLDDDAVKTVYKSSPLPSVPGWIPGSSVTLQMTMTYSPQ